MKQNKHKLWGFLLSLLSLCALLLAINLTSQSPQPAHAHTTQQTNNPPREILVNNECSKFNDVEKDGAQTVPTDAAVEKYRFGNETSHYYRFRGKAGNIYKITTNIFNGPTIDPVIGVDTILFLYLNNPLENPNEPIFRQNDDKLILEITDQEVIDEQNDPYESEIEFLAEETRYYYIEVQNLIESGNGTYCLGIEFRSDFIDNNSFPDKCEPNNSFISACEIQINPNITGTMNFKPSEGVGPDIDFYKIWVKPGERYTCSTTVTKLGNDTKMTLFSDDQYDAVLGVNDDKPLEPNVTEIISGTRSSKVVSNIGYTGWLYILVEPVVDEVDFEFGHLYQYNFNCTGQIFSQPIDSHQPAPNNTWDAPASSNSAVPQTGNTIETVAEATPTTQVVVSNPEAVSFVALPPRTPTPPPAQPGIPATFTLQIYHDANGNEQKDEGEGVSNLPVYLYTGLTATPLQALTTEGGAVFVNTETAVGTIQLFVPYLNINQEIAVNDVQDIRLRVGAR